MNKTDLKFLWNQEPRVSLSQCSSCLIASIGTCRKVAGAKDTSNNKDETITYFLQLCVFFSLFSIPTCPEPYSFLKDRPCSWDRRRYSTAALHARLYVCPWRVYIARIHNCGWHCSWARRNYSTAAFHVISTAAFHASLWPSSPWGNNTGYCKDI